MLFDVRTEEAGPWSLVRVVGEIDLATLPSLRQELDRTGGDAVALDLTSVDYVDPVALGVVLAGSLRASRRGGRFTLVCPPGRPRDLLAEVGVDRIVEVVDSVGDLGPPPADQGSGAAGP